MQESKRTKTSEVSRQVMENTHRSKRGETSAKQEAFIQGTRKMTTHYTSVRRHEQQNEM